MFRQRFDDDCAAIMDPKHIKKVWDAIKSGYAKYLKLMLDQEPLGLEKLSSLGSLKKSAKAIPPAQTNLMAEFKKAIEKFQGASDIYCTFFDHESMEEFASSPGQFKPSLNKGCPVIRHTLSSQAHELLEWHKLYNITKPRVLFDMFTNLIDFHTEYTKATKRAAFSKFDKPEAFKFRPIEDDDECRINGVIGMGIKSTVLYHLTPTLFPNRDRHSLLGFYILSDFEHFGLPTESSEFVMYDPEKTLKDGTIYGSHNYWYPYALFTLYSLRLYGKLKMSFSKLNVELDDKYRFVYTQTFLHEVCNLEEEKIKAFVAHDVLYRFTNEDP
jgi:hypothetical protein